MKIVLLWLQNVLPPLQNVEWNAPLPLGRHIADSLLAKYVRCKFKFFPFKMTIFNNVALIFRHKSNGPLNFEGKDRPEKILPLFYFFLNLMEIDFC